MTRAIGIERQTLIMGSILQIGPSDISFQITPIPHKIFLVILKNTSNQCKYVYNNE